MRLGRTKQDVINKISFYYSMGIRKKNKEVYRGPKKNPQFYKSIISLHHTYPKAVYSLLDNITIWGYYKDFFHILSHSTNDELNNNIYNRVSRIINEDCDCAKKNLPISTLAKWMPRENSPFDKRTGFVENFCKIFFINYRYPRHHTKYRKLISSLCDIMGVNERTLKVDNNLVSWNGSRSNIYCFKSFGPEAQEKIINNHIEKFNSYDIDYFINKVNHYNTDITNLNNPFCIAIKRLGEDFYKIHFNRIMQKINFNHNTFVFDIGQISFNTKLYVHLIGIMYILLRSNKRIIINNKTPTVVVASNADHYEQIIILQSLVTTSQTLCLEKINQLCPIEEVGFISIDRNKLSCVTSSFGKPNKFILSKGMAKSVTVVDQPQPQTILTDITELKPTTCIVGSRFTKKPKSRKSQFKILLKKHIPDYGERSELMFQLLVTFIFIMVIVLHCLFSSG